MEIAGIPFHSFAVHIPVALIVLAAIADIACLNRAWRSWLQGWSFNLYSYALPAAYFAYYTGEKRHVALLANQAFEQLPELQTIVQSHMDTSKTLLLTLLMGTILRVFVYLAHGKNTATAAFTVSIKIPLTTSSHLLVLAISLVSTFVLVLVGDSGGELLYNIGTAAIAK